MTHSKLILRIARRRAEIEATGALPIIVAGLLAALVIGLALAHLILA